MVALRATALWSGSVVGAQVTHTFASLSRDVLVLEASGVGDAEWLVFEREPDLAGMLASSRVAPNDDEGSIL